MYSVRIVKTYEGTEHWMCDFVLLFNLCVIDWSSFGPFERIWVPASPWPMTPDLCLINEQCFLWAQVKLAAPVLSWGLWPRDALHVDVIDGRDVVQLKPPLQCHCIIHLESGCWLGKWSTQMSFSLPGTSKREQKILAPGTSVDLKSSTQSVFSRLAFDFLNQHRSAWTDQGFFPPFLLDITPS